VRGHGEAGVVAGVGDVAVAVAAGVGPVAASVVAAAFLVLDLVPFVGVVAPVEARSVLVLVAVAVVVAAAVAVVYAPVVAAAAAAVAADAAVVFAPVAVLRVADPVFVYTVVDLVFAAAVADVAVAVVVGLVAGAVAAAMQCALRILAMTPVGMVVTPAVGWARVVAAVRTCMHCPEPRLHGVSSALHWSVHRRGHERG
jgi:hypothetical protein